MIVTAPPAPPIVIESRAFETPPLPVIRSYAAGRTACGGETVAAERIVEPVPSGRFLYPGMAASAEPIVLLFDVAGDGRPIGIRSERTDREPELSGDDDVAPAFAAWRFPSGAPRQGCRIRFVLNEVAATQADRQLLAHYLATRASPLFGSSPGEIADVARQHSRPADSTCPREPGSRIWYWPDFDAIGQPAGDFAWSYAGFDVNRRGKATGLRLIASSGNRDLDRRSLAALRHSVFTRPATGCTYNFFRRPSAPLPPPPAPESLAGYRDEGATCPAAADAGWARMAPLAYPQNFLRRAIEGWAVIRYDVAPWGQTGNVSVVEAQPAAGFGLAAKRIVEQSRREPARYGYTGCVDLVRFVMPPPEPRAGATAGRGGRR